jgi:type II secretory pathway component GspD/PulD (secretin)
MKLICHARERGKMKLANRTLGITLALALGGLSLWAQPAPADANPNPDSLQTFYLANVVSQSNDGNEIVTAIRNMISPKAKVYYIPSQSAIVVNTTPDQLVLAQKVIKDLDRPKKSYRLTYTFTEMDGGKSIGTQHFTMIVVSGQRTTLKQGSKVPVVTSTTNAGKSESQTQTTYVDVGLNFDVLLDESVNQVRLSSDVEQSSVAEQLSGVGAQDPIIRQTVLRGTSFLSPGKPLVLGSLDIPDSTRHMDIEVVMEAVR